MRICIDIDGTICELRKPDEDYKNLLPKKNAVEKLKELKQQGHYIILCTARHMKTCDSNMGQVLARQGLTLLEWLRQYKFEYDEIWFGKPYAHVYIDDCALEFKGSWNNIDDQILKKYELAKI